MKKLQTSQDYYLRSKSLKIRFNSNLVIKENQI